MHSAGSTPLLSRGVDPFCTDPGVQFGSGSVSRRRSDPNPYSKKKQMDPYEGDGYEFKIISLFNSLQYLLDQTQNKNKYHNYIGFYVHICILKKVRGQFNQVGSGSGLFFLGSVLYQFFLLLGVLDPDNSIRIRTTAAENQNQRGNMRGNFQLSEGGEKFHSSMPGQIYIYTQIYIYVRGVFK